MYIKFHPSTSLLGRPVLIVVALSACSSDNSSTVVDDPTIQDGLKVSAINPTQLQNYSLPSGNEAVARAKSPCLENGSPQVLSEDDGENFFASFDNFNTGDCPFSITFTYTDTEHGDVELVSGDIQTTLNTGQNTIAFTQGDYSETDSDGDGIINIVELSEPVRSNPFQRPIWGEMAWGKEVWTAK